jgi:NitT/TauT family transport system substrate-binding protein
MALQSRRDALGLLMAGTLAGVVQGTGRAVSQEKNLTKLRLRLDFLGTPSHAYFFAAQDRGFFEAEGLSVDILEGNSSAVAIQQVANKSEDFSVPGFDALVSARQEDVPAVMVLCVFRRTPAVLVSLRSSGISKAADLAGKTIGVRAGSGPVTIFPAYLAASGVDIDKVKLLNLDFSAFIPSLLQKRIDGFVGFAPTQYPVVKSLASEPVDVLHFSDAGIVTMSMGIVAHPDTVKERPDVVRGFVRAVQRGMQWVKGNPDEAAKLMMARFPRTIKPETAKVSVDISNTFLSTDRTKNKPLGYIDLEDARDTVKILEKYLNLTKVYEPGAYFTNAFIDNSIF